jgi:uncharacterized protein YqhQ
MQTLIEGLMANPGMENPFELHGAQEVHIVDTHSPRTHSPRNVKQRSSVGSRPSDVFFFFMFYASIAMFIINNVLPISIQHVIELSDIALYMFHLVLLSL